MAKPAEVYKAFDDALNTIERCIPALEKITDAVKSKDHIAVIRHFDVLRMQAARIKLLQETLNKHREAVSSTIVPDAMRAAGVRNTFIEGVGRVTISARFACSMLDKQQGMIWLRVHNLESLIQETVNSSSLSAWARNYIETEGKELPEQLFKTSVHPYTSVTKS